jgi:5-carboxymethyl-2-hydroxymuconate isomerase
VPHFIVEYTANLKADGCIPELLAKAARVMRAQGGMFPLGGIRVRAIEVKDYFIADGEEDYAFVHAHLKIGPGREEAEIKKALDELFAMLREHFAPLFEKRYLALSMEFTELNKHSRYRHNNMHTRFQAE